MLVFARKPQQIIRIGDDIKVYVVSIKHDVVKIGIEAPRAVPVHREEIYQQIRREKR